MNTLTSSLPWQFWFIWGWLMALVLLKYAVWPRKNTPSVPFAWKISWIVCFFMSFLVILTSFIDGTGYYKEFTHFIGQAVIPTILLLVMTLLVGGYQISMRPGFDPRKRRWIFIQMFIVIGCIIICGWIMWPLRQI
ncbi:MAG: hypothetical protein H6Q73_4520 [Firmicutes bacterium]|nr:hypothetical protein [Bacillota bacterium]